MSAQRTMPRQQRRSAAGSRAVSNARRSGPDRTKIIVGVIVVVVLAAAVVGGVLYQRHTSDAAAQTVIPALTVPGSARYPVSLDKAGATVLVGRPDAKVTIDTYEDFLCPVCGNFETTNANSVEGQLEAGKVKVRYHIINLLDNSSNPAGYSRMAANTALAVATVAPDKFVNFHYSLYQKQPKENGPGWTQAQLTSLANRLGVGGPAFDNLVNNHTYEGQVQANLTSAENDRALFQTSSGGGTGFGTPTVVVNGGAPVNWQVDTWLADAERGIG